MEFTGQRTLEERVAQSESTLQKPISEPSWPCMNKRKLNSGRKKHGKAVG
jgi:hypothetical protein